MTDLSRWGVRIHLDHKASDSDKPNPVSWAVYHTQCMEGGDGFYWFTFTSIHSDQWARVTGELARYNKWKEGEPEDKDEFPVVLRVHAEPDTVEDGFVSIAYWLNDLIAWSVAIHGGDNDD